MIATAADALYGCHVLYLMLRDTEKGTDVSNGYAASSWRLSTDATISLFQGSQLVAPYWAQYTSSVWQGQLSQTFPVGSYSCMIRHPRFYTAFFRVCDIPPEVRPTSPLTFPPSSSSSLYLSLRLSRMPHTLLQHMRLL
jgi:hypothetical protein